MEQKASGGIGFLGILTIVLVVLKAMGYLHCSWFIVFLPVLIPLFILLGVTLVAAVIFFLKYKG